MAFDDLRLLVDGQPIGQARPIETVLDRDRAFDDGSGVTLERLSPQQVENLAALGQVWGFLKYHHPRVTAGELHWDYELFRVLPAVLAAPDRAGANAELAAWIERLGPLAPAASRAATSANEADVHLRPDTGDWASDTKWGAALGQKLRAVLTAGTGNAKSFYVSLAAGVGNPRFEHEPDYAHLTAPDAGYRLLGLFRFWNIIRYWFPYRDLIGEDWGAVLAEFVPRVGLAASADDYAREMMALIARVHDTHANLWSTLRVQPPVGEGGIDAELRFVEGQLLVANTGAGVDGLRRGDLIEAIGGRPVSALLAEWSPLYAASNEPTRRRDIARNALRGPIGPVTVQLRRGDASTEVTLQRVERRRARLAFHDLPGPAFRLLSAQVGYLKLSSAKSAELSRHLEQARDTRGLIVDLRNYPAEFLVFSLGGRLVDQPTPFAVFTGAEPGAPGKFSFRDGQALQPKAPRYAGRVVVLLDEVSQSQAEYTAMALRAAGAVIVGSTTAGADGNVSAIPLPGGLRSMISGIGVFYPDRRPTQRIGIVPDIEARPTIEGLRAGRDEVLEAAWREIMGPAADLEPLRAIVRQSANEKTP